jgi:succinyldiaminopimelate transaminase
MYNDALDGLTDYPFDRLRALLGPIEPPAGVAPLTMSLGEPQHPPPPMIAETIARHAELWGRYPPIAGSEDLLVAIRDWLERRYDLPKGMIEPGRHIVAVSGTREALYMACDLAVPRRKNGEIPTILMPNPFYQVYQGAAVMARAEPVYLAANKANGFLPDFAAAGEKRLARAALAYVCSPANPQGAIAGLDYLKDLVRLARKHDFVLCVDECYAEIYDRERPPGMLQACADMGGDMTNVLVFHSLSKRSSAPGLRSGFVAGDPDLIRRLKVLRNYGGATLPGPILAASAALWRDEAHVEVNRALYREKFDRAEQMLAGRFGYYRPEGGFFLWLDVGDGEAAAAKLWAEGAVRVIPGVYLARPDETGVNPGKGYIRVALVHEPDQAAEGIRRISEIL